ncbi:MAG TPA: bifunctional histidinol-phosphatase/imidazoleglycerol-phosphate dehydratase HisB [Xanthomonadaceae bacterium]|nr:bifunctional histidinol-phosphatase/imidazoleglycerol-phosphate dehydratase HisB [Xanthomonadaceae bacterium]
MSAPSPVLFVDRDGTLIEEPADQQVDAYAKVRFVRGVVPALLRLRDAGWQFVMVTNQDGLGTPAFPREDFEGPHALMLQLFESQGIVFRDVRIDASRPADGASTRKPGIGLVLDLLRDRDIDWTRSAVVGDRDTDLQFAGNLGVRGFRVGDGPDAMGWDAIAHALADAPRTARVQRATAETRVGVGVDLDGRGDARIDTGIGFLDHMLEQVARHGRIDLDIRCDGDLGVDEHHTVEDTALALGQALREALGPRRGIRRYGFTVAMDETRCDAVVDLSGRPWLQFEGRFARESVGGLPTELVSHFFRSLCDGAGMTLHLAVDGRNDHHQVEACFKAFGRALGDAVRREGSGVPSTKGVL